MSLPDSHGIEQIPVTVRIYGSPGGRISSSGLRQVGAEGPLLCRDELLRLTLSCREATL
jgi:hypothetical protein